MLLSLLKNKKDRDSALRAMDFEFKKITVEQPFRSSLAVRIKGEKERLKREAEAEKRRLAEASQGNMIEQLRNKMKDKIKPEESDATVVVVGE
jgi:regulator of protease activity HflC (stomatin/prohibitin superfamily)